MPTHKILSARTRLRSVILFTAISLAPNFRASATTIESTYTGTAGGDWNTTVNWTPAGIPNNGGGNVYDVTDPFTNGVTLSNATDSINNFTVPDAVDGFSTAGPLTIHSGTLAINGTASFGTNQIQIFSVPAAVIVACGDPVNTAGSALLSMQNVTNYEPTTQTLSDVDWTVAHDNTSAPGVTSTLQFNNADVVTLDNSDINIEESQANFTDQNGNDALRHLSALTNDSSLTYQEHNFTTGGDFSLSDDSSLSANGCTFNINGSLANFNTSNGVLTGGKYTVQGAGVIQFNNANILTNRAFIILSEGSSIRDQNGNDGLRNLAVNDTNGTMQLLDQSFTTAGDFTNSGVLFLDSDSKPVEFRVNGTLTDYSPTTHTLGGAGNYTLNTVTLPDILQFNNADIVTNDANISLIGLNSNIVDQNGNNGLRDFAVNGPTGQFAIDGRSFTTAGDFTNDGVLTVAGGSGSSPSSTFDITGNLTNYNATTHTLTGGDYQLQGDGTAPATLEFSNADITTNAATIQLFNNCGINDQNGNDGLRHFALNTASGDVQLVNHDLTLPGTFTNAGTMEISSSTVTVPTNSSYLQTSGQTILGGGTLSASGSSGVTIQSGQLTGAGQITGNLHLTGGTLSPGSGTFATDIIAVSANLDTNSSSSFSFDIGGTTRGEGGFDPVTFATLLGYSAIDVSGAASVNGQLHVDLLSGFTPDATDQFVLLDATSPITGSFTNVPSGDEITTDNGAGTFFVYYGVGSPFDPDDVVLSQFTAVPEPSCTILLLAGCAMHRRRKTSEIHFQ